MIAHPARGLDRRRACAASRRSSGPTPCARSTPSARCCAAWSRPLGSNDPPTAAEHARQLVEENKRLKSELGRLRAGDRDAVDRPPCVEGADAGRRRARSWSRRSRARIPAGCATSRRRSATSSTDRARRGRRGQRRGRQGHARGRGHRGLRRARGHRARAARATAAKVIGGGAGGKDILANAGGKHAERGRRRRSAASRRASQELLGARLVMGTSP